MDSVDDSTEEPTSTLERVRKARKDADDSGQSTWRTEAKDWYSFAAGDQWTSTERADLLAQLRPPVCFNRIGPMVDSVSGSEVNNRQQVQYIPRQFGDKALNEVLTGAADYVRDNCDAEDEESDAFLDAVICGVGVTETRIDYEEDPDGCVLVERRDPLSMRWDPGAKKRNLMDRCWQQYDAMLPKATILQRWPDADIIGIVGGTGPDGGSGAQPHDSSRNEFYERNASGGEDARNGLLRVTHHQWFEVEPFYQLLDPGTNQVMDLSVSEHTKLQKRLKHVAGFEAQSVRKSRRVYKEAFVCGATVLQERVIDTNRFTFHFITAKRDRNANTWYGIVKPMMDPQRWANKFFSQILHIINTNAKGGLMMEVGAHDNPEKLKTDWAKSDSVVVFEEGALSGGKVQQKPPPAIPPDLNSMLQFSLASMRDVTGINLELLGMADRQQAGVVEAQRKQAAMTVLATLFDGLRRYRKEQGRTLAAFITEYLSDGRLVRIVGGDGTERYVPLVRDPQAMKYDVVVDEAPASVNQKERTFAMLMQMLPNLQQMGVPFAPDLLDYTPLPAAMVEKWKQILAQGQANPQMVQQLQQANAQMQQQLQQANMRLQSKDQEIAAKLREAELKADSDLTAALRKAQMDAQADYASAVHKATTDAQAAVQKAMIEAQAKIEVAQVTAAATPQPQPTIVQMPEQAPNEGMLQAVRDMQQLMQMVQRVADSHASLAGRIEEVGKTAGRKPKFFNHERDPKTGLMLRSIPVFD